MKFNFFSKHDNRHTLESCGDHLGGPYGRRHADLSRNQHFTGSMNIKWDNVKPQYSSTYASGYGRRALKRVSSAASEDSRLQSGPAVDRFILDRFYPVPTKEHFSRFPKRYELPKDRNFAKPSVNTSWWSSDSSQSSSSTTKKGVLPSLAVLGATQLPHLRKNAWKYSYKP